MSLISSGTQNLIITISDLAVVLSLLVLAYQVYLQRKATEYGTYDKLMSDLSAATPMLLDNPDILDLTVKGRGKLENWERYSKAEKKAYCFFDSIMQVLERAYFQVPKKDWSDWEKWVKNLLTNKIFMDVFNDNCGMYNEEFVKAIQSIISEGK